MLVYGLALYAVLSLISMATMSIGAAVLAVFLLVEFRGPVGLFRAIRREIETPAGRLYLIATGALSLACLVSIFYMYVNPVSYDGKSPQSHFLWDLAKLWYLFWPPVLAAAIRRLAPGSRRAVLRAWILAFGVLSVIGVFQHFTGWPREQPIPGEPGHFHAILFLGHHLSVASVFIFPFFGVLDALYRAVRRLETPILPAWLLAPTAALGFVTLFFTYSRTLWIALPIGLLAWCVITLRNRWAFAAVGLIAMAVVGAFQVPAIATRAHAQIGFIHREDLWKANFHFLAERPLTGVGWRHNEELSGYYLMTLYPGQSVWSGHAHNNLIDLLGSTGILGALAWLFWCGVIFWILGPLAAQLPATGYSVGLVCAWIVFQLNGITQVNFWEGKVQHQMMWAVAWSLIWASEKLSSGKLET